VNILYVGDVMGEPGMKVLEEVLPKIKKEHAVDLTIAQAENVTEGKGISKEDFKRLLDLGVDFCTGGNWSGHRPEIEDHLSDPQQPVIRPANYPEGTPGRGWKYVHTKDGAVLVVSLLGHVVGRDADKPTDNPLKVIDAILEENQDVERLATLVNFHGDFSSEKRVIGYYLDGKVTAVIGDHWHVPTADAMILPKGTAHITDVGMCGSLHSSLGIDAQTIISRWRDGQTNKNELATDRPYQFNALLIETDTITGLATSVLRIQKYL
jgi:2',3'-cyclic-nucleotide 2'-phosphodiesterase